MLVQRIVFLFIVIALFSSVQATEVVAPGEDEGTSTPAELPLATATEPSPSPDQLSTTAAEKSATSREDEYLLSIFSREELKEVERIHAHFQFKFSDLNLDQNPLKKSNLKKLRAAADRGHTRAKAYFNFLGFLSSANDAEIPDSATDHLNHLTLGFMHSVGIGRNVSQARALLHFTMAALPEDEETDILAKMILAYRYWTGVTVQSNCELSLKFYQQVANFVVKEVTFSGGPAIHRIRLLDEIENSNNVLGTGILDNDLIEFYQLLAHKGDIQAQVGLGQLHYQGGRGIYLDHQKALQYFQLAANGGNAIAMAYLGKIYLEGDGDTIAVNHELAFKYFEKSAELGNPVGQSGLGVMYLEGRGVPRNTMQALKYFQLAADQGWVDGQLQLGNMYFEGVGVKRDYKMAHKYFSLASQSGHVLAYYHLGQMYAGGLGIVPSCPTAVELFKNVAERGKWAENLMFAYQYFKRGQYRRAFLLYALLADLGYEVAQSNAAFILDKTLVEFNGSRVSERVESVEAMAGGAVEEEKKEEQQPLPSPSQRKRARQSDQDQQKPRENLIRALQYWSRAASQGYSSAQVKMGDYYYYGWGTDVDYELAAAHYRIASETQHNAQAMFNLGYMHEQGLGMKRDWHLAKRCYDLAAETNADAKIPVALALFKLQFMFKLENLRSSHFNFIFSLTENMVSNWDLYLITALTATLGLIFYLRRPVPQ